MAAKLNDETTPRNRSEEHTSELQSRGHLVCRLLLEKKKTDVEVFSGLTGRIINTFFDYARTCTGGQCVAGGLLTREVPSDIVPGGGQGVGAHVHSRRGATV